MAFFDDLFDSITNQQATPQQTIIPTADLLNQSYATAQGQFPNLGAYNMGLLNATMPSQLSAESMYDPTAFDLRRNVGQSFLDDLSLGNQVPQDLQDLITTNTLQGLGTSGVGTADAGKLFGARSLLSAGLDLGRQRRMDAAGYSSSSPSLSSLFQPDRGFSPGAISQDLRAVQAAKDEYANIAENTRRENFSALINTGGRILGTAAGAYFGGAMGAQMGGQIGGSLGGKTGVAGYGNKSAVGGPQYGIGSQSGGGFGSLFSQLGTQGNYGQGSGGFFGIGANQYDQGADMF